MFRQPPGLRSVSGYHAELDRGLHTSATYTVQHAVEGGAAGPVGTDEVHLPRGAQAAAGAHRHQAAPGTDGPRRAPGTRSAQRADVDQVPAARPGVPSARYQVCRGARPGRPERGHPGRQPQGPDRAAEPLLHLGAIPRAAGGGPGVAAERLCRAEPRDRHPHRRGQGAALGSRRPGRRSGRGAARAAVWRSVREGGDTKTARSRRTPALPQAAVQALREHRKRQAEDRLAAGSLWQDHGLVFASAVGTPLDAANVRREFRQITEAAGLGLGWAPRDLRHTFVSPMSADGVPIEEIARLADHNRTATTELVYRHELRPVIITGAEVMDRILNLRGWRGSGFDRQPRLPGDFPGRLPDVPLGVAPVRAPC